MSDRSPPSVLSGGLGRLFGADSDGLGRLFVADSGGLGGLFVPDSGGLGGLFVADSGGGSVADSGGLGKLFAADSGGVGERCLSRTLAHARTHAHAQGRIVVSISGVWYAAIVVKCRLQINLTT